MRLGTIYLEVGAEERVAALRAFYRDRLGLSIAIDEGDHSVWFDAGAVRVGFHASDGDERDPGTVNLSFDVDDVAGEVERLRSEGVEIAQGPMDAPWDDGTVVAVLFDPVGHTVWLSGPKPDAPEAATP